jgi:hypothetical protein
VTVSAPDDPSEREAERIAEDVTTRSGTSRRSAPRVQQRVGDGAGVFAHARHPDDLGSSVGAERLASLARSGQPLPPVTRGFFEARLGVDFSQVRVHTGADASRLAGDVGARAFTWGRHVVFADGEYDPASRQGRKLLAHELTHTIQQSIASGAVPTVVQRQVTKAPASACTKAGFTFRPKFTGVVNGRKPRKANNFVPRAYYSEIPGHPKSKNLGALKTGTTLTAGPAGGYGDLWRQVCAKSEQAPAQKMWVLNDYIDEKRPPKAKPKPQEAKAKTTPKAGQTDDDLVLQWIQQRGQMPDPFGAEPEEKKTSWIEWIERGGDVVKSIESSHYKSDEHRLADVDRFLVESAGRAKEFAAQRRKAVAYRLRLVEWIAEQKRRSKTGPESRPSMEWTAPPGTMAVDIDYAQAPVPHVDVLDEASYIDNLVTQVGVRLMDGTFHLFIEGRERAMTIPSSWVFAGGEPIQLNDRVYGSREDAFRALGSLSRTHYAYWKAEGGLVLPTRFTPSSAPRIVWGARDAIRAAAEYGEGVFMGVLEGMILGKAIELGVRAAASGTTHLLEKHAAPGELSPGATAPRSGGTSKPKTKTKPKTKKSKGKTKKEKSKASGKATFRDQLRAKGFSDDAVRTLERSGFDFDSATDRRQLTSVAAAKNKTFVNFANEFHEAHGVDHVFRDWKVGGNKRSGANLVMRRALDVHTGRKIEFERPGGKGFGAKGQEHAARKADIVVHPGSPGQRTQFEEAKSWVVDPAQGNNSIAKNPQTVLRELGFDVAAFDRDFKWVFDGKKVVPPSGVSPKELVVDSLLPVVKKSDYLVTKLGPSDGEILTSLERIVVIKQ